MTELRHSAADNEMRLVAHVRSILTPNFAVPQEARELSLAFGTNISNQVMNPDNVYDIQREVNLVHDAILRRYNHWRAMLPVPTAEQAIWPQDFTTKERRDVRKCVKEKLDRDSGYWHVNISEKDLRAKIEQLKFDMMPDKARSQQTMHRVVVQLRAEKRGQESKKAKRKLTANQLQCNMVDDLVSEEDDDNSTEPGSQRRAKMRRSSIKS